eukprot:2094804-Amphidinium_carterae.1
MSATILAKVKKAACALTKQVSDSLTKGGSLEAGTLVPQVACSQRLAEVVSPELMGAATMLMSLMDIKHCMQQEALRKFTLAKDTPEELYKLCMTDHEPLMTVQRHVLGISEGKPKALQEDDCKLAITSVAEHIDKECIEPFTTLVVSCCTVAESKCKALCSKLEEVSCGGIKGQPWYHGSQANTIPGLVSVARKANGLLSLDYKTLEKQVHNMKEASRVRDNPKYMHKTPTGIVEIVLKQLPHGSHRIAQQKRQSGATHWQVKSKAHKLLSNLLALHDKKVSAELGAMVIALAKRVQATHIESKLIQLFADKRDAISVRSTVRQIWAELRGAVGKDAEKEYLHPAVFSKGGLKPSRSLRAEEQSKMHKQKLECMSLNMLGFVAPLAENCDQSSPHAHDEEPMCTKGSKSRELLAFGSWENCGCCGSHNQTNHMCKGCLPLEEHKQLITLAIPSIAIAFNISEKA